MSQDITVTDMFCGAGGSSIGVEAAGATLRFASNHWQTAVDTHNANFPNADHDCADIHQADPRRYPTTDVLIASPECTNHSQAKGVGRKSQDATLFDEPDPSAERSRATMWCPPRFAEQHHYPVVIIENVVEARKWVGFTAWLQYWESQNYDHQILYLNSMHFGSTSDTEDRWVAQSRDRMYVVLWKKGNRKPELQLRPRSWCWTCEGWCEGIQTFKDPTKPWGKYRQQYVYRCHVCHEACEPVVAPAARIIDWTLPAGRIGDRLRPLADATRRRIAIGLERFGYPVVIQKSGNTFERDQAKYVRAWPADLSPVPTLTAELHHGIGFPPAYMVQTRHHGADGHRVRGVGEPMWTVPGSDVENALVIPMRNHGRARRAVDDPVSTVTCGAGGGGMALTLPPFLVQAAHSGEHANRVRSVMDPSWTVQAGGGGAGIAFPDAFYVKGFGVGDDPSMTHHVSDPLGTVTVQDHHSLLIPYRKDSLPTRAAEAPFPTQHTKESSALCWPEMEIDDCRFRMFEPHEIGRAMAFSDSYQLSATTKKDKVKLYGNAVTPPAMSWIFERALETLR